VDGEADVLVDADGPGGGVGVDPERRGGIPRGPPAAALLARHHPDSDSGRSWYRSRCSGTAATSAQSSSRPPIPRPRQSGCTAPRYRISCTVPAPGLMTSPPKPTMVPPSKTPTEPRSKSQSGWSNSSSRTCSVRYSQPWSAAWTAASIRDQFPASPRSIGRQTQSPSSLMRAFLPRPDARCNGISSKRRVYGYCCCCRCCLRCLNFLTMALIRKYIVVTSSPRLSHRTPGPAQTGKLTTRRR
jgi:hypothetical protein